MNETNKQLPPELVDKLDKSCLSILDGTILNPMQVAQLSDLISEQCAKIAVDYYNATISKELEKVQNEMDELLEALQESQLQLEYLSEKFGETGSCNSVISRNKTLIQKYDS